MYTHVWFPPVSTSSPRYTSLASEVHPRSGLTSTELIGGTEEEGTPHLWGVFKKDTGLSSRNPQINIHKLMVSFLRSGLFNFGPYLFKHDTPRNQDKHIGLPMARWKTFIQFSFFLASPVSYSIIPHPLKIVEGTHWRSSARITELSLKWLSYMGIWSGCAYSAEWPRQAVW